jgi:hypothetical protein
MTVMGLVFSGPGGSFERRWIVYAMLRDNVQHHLEGGTPSLGFSALHALSDAVLNGSATVSALKLRDEAERATVLIDRPISDLAVSIRTRAVTTRVFPLPEVRGTLLASLAGWGLPFPLEHARKLGDLFGSLVDELLRVTEGAREGDEVTVSDE